MSEVDEHELDALIAAEKRELGMPAEPPAGGLERLRADVARGPAPSGASHALRAGAVVAVVVLGALVASRLVRHAERPVPSRPAPTSTTAPPVEPVAAEPAARPTTPVPSGDDALELAPSADGPRAGAPSAPHHPGRNGHAVTTTDPAPQPIAPTAEAAPSRDTLSEELALLRAAQLALNHGEPDRAIALAEEHARRFPEGVLAPERRALERRARCRQAEATGAAAPGTPCP